MILIYLFDLRLPKLLVDGFTFLGAPPFLALELLEFDLKSRDLGFGFAERSGFLVVPTAGARCPDVLALVSGALSLDS